ncbi:hypothetical protein FXF51_27855 [Nonomuraea sp. PA05]|uniref:hypothetical protein n=1 Tax=Nonomuraea sp. PA05 TaxID=2604466 RepID=UPI0011D9C6A3|nr:hypothetical protein [Nonomuraea sp. PA05]TYB61880.1 hypothetical protein FXF51_27855 [Nonomuraea sp. PA05]
MNKRLTVALLSTALAAGVLTGGGPAHASPDPVKSLREQFAEGRGVRVSETTRGKTSKVKEVPPTRTTGTIEFGTSGAVDYDLTSRWKAGPSSEELQAIKVGRHTYVRGFEWGPMPEGKKWIRFTPGEASWGNDGQRGDQVVDVFNPRILRAMLAKATVRKGGEYRGVLTGNDLYGKYSYAEFTKVSYRLFLDRRGLPIRLITEYTSKWTDTNGKNTYRPVVDTRYTGYGAKVKITPPPADEVVGFKDLEGPFAAQDGDEPLTLDRGDVSAR